MRLDFGLLYYNPITNATRGIFLQDNIEEKKLTCTPTYERGHIIFNYLTMYVM